MRIALSILAALHGIAHLVGFAVPWRLVDSPDAPYTTTVLGGRLDLGAAGIRAVGILWLLVAAAFVLSAALALTNRAFWLPTMLAVTTISLMLTLVNLPASRIGVPINIAILAALLLGSRLGWF